MSKSNKNSWDKPVLGRASKNVIRLLVTGVFGKGTFGTLRDTDHNGRIEIDIENADSYINQLTSKNGEKFAQKLRIVSGLDVIFGGYNVRRERVDLHDYEPTKISPGTYEYIAYYAIVLTHNKPL